jgi:hypothetical protein
MLYSCFGAWPEVERAKDVFRILIGNLVALYMKVLGRLQMTVT